ncbi:MAG: GNAT family N-acetyltransferase [Thermoanaerobaculia bacterium]|nr:GNAT family N-acetyltransferase [Thermoanaerobaculia bacterium]
MSGRLVVRDLRTPEEFIETTHVSKAAWGFAERAVSPASDLVAATHAGGLTAAAFLGGKMVGFVHGIPRTNLGEPCQHSHLLAVKPEAQGRGLSVKLKLHQRAWCLARGIRLVTWTYDPFLLKNAKLNIGHLRATARTFHPNFYGLMGGIYGDLPSDRFEVAWRLDDPVVVRAAAGEARPRPDASGLPIARSPRSLPSGRRLLLPFPAGAPGIYRTDHDGTLKERHRFAALVKPLFARGYEVTDVVVDSDGTHAYVLDRVG